MSHSNAESGAMNNSDDSKAKPVVGFIGLGLMGRPMSRNLMNAGFALVVHDHRREAADELVQAGATWASTPRELAQQCDVMFSCLPGVAEIEAVALGADGVVAGIRPGCAYFEMSTNSHAVVRRMHAAFAARGAHFLDAPISGGPTGAQRRQLAVWVGGDAAAYRRCEPVLRAMADHPTHVGDIGAGLVTKLVHNCAAEAMQASLAEAFVMGVKAGADPLSLWQAIRQGAVGRRRTFDGLIDQFLPGTYDQPQAAQRVTYKDMMFATELGRDLGVPMRFANLSLADTTESMNRGWAERDCRAVMLLPQERAGVKIAVAPAAIQEVLRSDPAAPTDTRHGIGATRTKAGA